MTLIEPIGEAPAKDILLLAERHFERALARLESGIAGLEEAGASKEAQALLRDLTKAMQTAFDERSKVEKLRKQTAGVIGATALDFDKARAEIGRRMACLRAAERAGEISE